MIKSLLRKLFRLDNTNERRNEIVIDLKSHPQFRPNEEMHTNKSVSTSSAQTLEKGKVESIYAPKLGNQSGLILTKWYVKPGDLVKSGDIVCEIENDNISIEFETYYNGKVVWTCELHKDVTNGIEIFKIEGI